MRHGERGFSLIELLITLAIFGVLLALGASSFRAWIVNMKIRSTAESVQSGLQLARGEAVRRNTAVMFQLTTTTENGCALALVAPDLADANWVVSLADAAGLGLCGGAYLNEAYPIADSTHNPAPQIIQRRSAAEGSGSVKLSAGQTSFTFNGLGRLTGVPLPNIDVKPSTGSCTGVRCLRVTVTLGGQIRMCDPAFTPDASGGTDSQRCPTS
jgi:type IV fimbrial biogenesis protein FimT